MVLGGGLDMKDIDWKNIDALLAAKPEAKTHRDANAPGHHKDCPWQRGAALCECSILKVAETEAIRLI